jgi:nicotinic acid mononucleotide adenylyltransferase
MDHKTKINLNSMNYFPVQSHFQKPIVSNLENLALQEQQNEQIKTQLQPFPSSSVSVLTFDSPVPSASISHQQPLSNSSTANRSPQQQQQQQATPSSSSKLPSYTEIYTSSPNAAGLPILEIIKKLEEESVITKQDRLLLKDAIYNEDLKKREEIIKVLCEIELNNHSRFTVRRLKAILYENGSGVESSSKLIPTQRQPQQQLPSQQKKEKQIAAPASSSSQITRVGQLALKSSSDTNFYSQINQSNSNGSNQLDKSKRIYVSENNLNQQQEQSNEEETVDGIGRLRQSSVPSNRIKSGKDEVSPITSSRSAAASSHYTSSSSSSKMLRGNISPTAYQSPEVSSSRNPTMNGSSGTEVLSFPQQQQHQLPPRQQSQQLQQPPHHSATKREISPLKQPSKLDNNNSKSPAPANDDTDEEEEKDMWNVQDNITKVMGSSPDYAGSNNNANILSKINKRLMDLQSKVNLTKLLSLGTRKLAVLVGSGSFNPLTRMHLRTYYLAKQYLESHYGYLILGSLLSPAHSVTVRERYRTNPSEIIPSPHRLAVAQLLVTNSQWLSIDPWELTRRRAMDYLSLLEHTSTLLKEAFPNFSITIFYVCKVNNVPIISPVAMKNQNFHCVTVCRSHESDILRSNLSSKWNGSIHVVEDNAILDASLDMITSRKVRDKIKDGDNVEQLVGAKINEYISIHRLGPKVIFVINYYFVTLRLFLLRSFLFVLFP